MSEVRDLRQLMATEIVMKGLAFRIDGDAVADALAELLPDIALRRAVAEVFAASIRFVHALAPMSWGLTVWSNYVRLNVGQIAVLDANADEMVLYTVAGPSPADSGYVRNESHNYSAVQVPTERWSIPLDTVSRLDSRLWERHRDLIQTAAQAKRFSPFKRSHSPGGVEAIARFTESVVPQPAYVDDAGLPLDDSREIEAAVEGLFGSDVVNRDVEHAAIELARTRFTANGWEVHSVERDRCGYDLHCQRRDRELHVEVKGVRGDPTRFVLTAGEVRRAETDPDFVLILVGRALDAEPTWERWSGRDMLRAFVLEPLHYVARRQLTSR